LAAALQKRTLLVVDNDFSVDVAEITSTIRSADVITIRFVTIGQRLLLDFRATELDGPMVRVVKPVRSVQERYAHLKQLRPRLPAPDKIVAIWWPRFMPSLSATGVWDEVMQRVTESGYPGAVREAETTFAELIGLEEGVKRAAIRGEGFKTLWGAPAAPR
jgi:hypothetical protein